MMWVLYTFTAGMMWVLVTFTAGMMWVLVTFTAGTMWVVYLHSRHDVGIGHLHCRHDMGILYLHSRHDVSIVYLHRTTVRWFASLFTFEKSKAPSGDDKQTAQFGAAVHVLWIWLLPWVWNFNTVQITQLINAIRIKFIRIVFVSCVI